MNTKSILLIELIEAIPAALLLIGYILMISNFRKIGRSLIILSVPGAVLMLLPWICAAFSFDVSGLYERNGNNQVIIYDIFSLDAVTTKERKIIALFPNVSVLFVAGLDYYCRWEDRRKIQAQ